MNDVIYGFSSRKTARYPDVFGRLAEAAAARAIAHSRQSLFERRWCVYGGDLWRSVNKSPVVDPLDWTQSAKLCRLKLIENVSSAVRELTGCVSAPILV